MNTPAWKVEQRHKHTEYVVICQVIGGVTGFREGLLKKEGQARVFESREAAETEAARLTKEMNGPYATCHFRYWPVAR